MALPAFDTLEFVDELEKSGIPEKQARAISVAVRKVHDSSDVATKADIVGLSHDMDAKHESLRRDLADAEERTDAKLDKLGAELRHEISDLHKDNESLRKDMDAKFTGVDAKLSAMEERSDAKHESLRKDMDAKLDKLGLQLTVRLGLISAAFFTLGPSISKFLHLPT